MGEYLEKEDTLFERGEDGNLLPTDLPLPLLNKENPPKIKIIPISRGKWRKILGMTDEEQDLIK